jgi:ABC-type multidrug transport system permease subunit
MPLKPRRFLAILIARNKEYWRDRAALGWSFGFPLLVVLAFGFAFSGDTLDLYKVGVIDSADSHQPLAFTDTEYIQFIPVNSRQSAVIRVERHQLDMLVEPAARRYWINDSSARGYILERVLRGSGGADFVRQTVSGREIRYIDWLVPGVLSMNMMFSALFGVGYVIVRYRKNGVLKRLKATPLSAFEFLAAQMVSRLWLILAVSALVYAGTDMLVDFRMFGSYLDLLLVFTLGSVSMISLALLVAARVSSEELAGGLLNLIGWPMMFLSGVWFSLEGLHRWVQALAQLLPLTHLIAACRAIMIDGAGLAEVSGQIAALLTMTVIFLAIGSYSFRWQ